MKCICFQDIHGKLLSDCDSVFLSFNPADNVLVLSIQHVSFQK